MHTMTRRPAPLLWIVCLLLGLGALAMAAQPRHVTVTATRYELIDSEDRILISVHTDDEQPETIRIRDGDGALLATADAERIRSWIELPHDMRDRHRQIDDVLELLHGRLRLAMQRGDDHDRRLREIENERRPEAETRDRDERIRRLEQKHDRIERDRERLIRQVDEAERTIRTLERRVRDLERSR